MFYSEAILSKKGPLAKVWLAAHWERKLSKSQFLQTNIHSSVDAIMGTDQAPMALRLSGQLLLGVARIYSRKTKYLLEDCNEALIKIKVAFRADGTLVATGPGGIGSNTLTIDLPMDNAQARAALNAITTQDTLTEMDLLLPANDFDTAAWGLNPKQSALSRLQALENDSNDTTGNLTLDDMNNTDDLSDLFSGRHSLAKNHRLDIEMGRHSRIGGGGYSAMDFDLAGPDDALDLGLFGDDLLNDRNEVDFMFESLAAQRRNRMQTSSSRNDDIEVGRDAVVDNRRSLSVDLLGDLHVQKQLPGGEKAPSSRAPSEVAGGDAHVEDNGFDFSLTQPEGDRTGFDQEFDNNNNTNQVPEFEDEFAMPTNNNNTPRGAAQPKKRKLIVDTDTELTQEQMKESMDNPELMTHDILPRSRKLLRLQQIESDVAHGGLAGYFLDFSAGPRGLVHGDGLVPELVNLFSRRLTIDHPSSQGLTEGALAQMEGIAEDITLDTWNDGVQPHDDENTFTAAHDNFDEMLPQTTPPPASASLMFDDFHLGGGATPPRGHSTEPTAAAEAEIETEEQQPRELTSSQAKSASTLFQDIEEATSASTMELNGTVFSTSAVQTMRLVHKGLEAQSDSTEESSTATLTRHGATIGASAVANQQNKARVSFSTLMGSNNSTQTVNKKRGDAAKLFFELLVLSTKDVVKVEQAESFGEIQVGGSPWLDSLVKEVEQIRVA